MREFAALPTSPSPARLRRGPSLSPLKGGEGLHPVAQYSMCTIGFDSPDSPALSRESRATF
jgi:hypothetical protein